MPFLGVRLGMPMVSGAGGGSGSRNGSGNLSGVTASGSDGLVTTASTAVSANLTGISATGSDGIVTVTTTMDGSANLAGVTGTGSAGSVTTAIDAAQTVAFLARTSGLSATETAAYKSLINGMVADGTFAKLDLLYIFATNTATTALLNLVSTSFTATNTGSLTFTADRGFTGTGSVGGFIDTAWTPSTNAVNYTLNAGMTGAYNRTSRTTGNNMTMYGCNNVAGTSYSYFRGRNASNNIEVGVNDAAFGGFANGNAQGSWVSNRTSSTNIDVFKNAGSTRVGNVTATSVALPDRKMQVFQLGNGTGQGPTTDQQAAFWAGGGFSATDVSNLQSRINAYMTAVGANVY